MAFELSQEIERCLDEALGLIKIGRYSTPRLAEAIGGSIPNVSRIMAALRN